MRRWIGDLTSSGAWLRLAPMTAADAQRRMDEAEMLADLGSWTMVASTREIAWSRQMYRIYGRDFEGFTPEFDSLLAQVFPADRERVLATAERAMESGSGYELDYRILRPDGEVREVHSRVRGSRSADGSLIRLHGTLQDRTSMNAMARHLAEANHRLSEVNQLNADVLGILGHDVRQPVVLLLGHLEELTDTWQLSPEPLKLLRVERAYSAASRLTTLIENILAMANFDMGAIATAPATVRVREAVEEALEHDRLSDLEVLGSPTAIARIDPFHLRQIVTNLVSNARRYGAPPLSITVGEGDGKVLVKVSDHGEGVPAEFVPHLFKRFARATTGVASERTGSGFGLYIVGRLAEANGAWIEYAPHEPTGSCFTLALPAAPA